MRIRKAKSEEEYRQFAEGFIRSNIDLEYLRSNDTYLLIIKGKIAGGYVFADRSPYRTFEAVKCDKLKAKSQKVFQHVKATEVTCLWLDKSYRGHLSSKIIWLSIGWNAFTSNTDYFLYGSSVKRLTDPMGAPEYVHKVLQTEIDEQYGKGTVRVFLVQKKRTFIAMLQGIYSFFFPNKQWKKKHNLYHLSINTPEATKKSKQSNSSAQPVLPTIQYT